MLIIALACVAWAEDSEFVGAEQPPAEAPAEVENTLSAELGGTLVTGNAVFYAVNGALAGSSRWNRNKLSVGGGVNIGAAQSDTDGDGLLSAAERSAGFTQNVKRYWAEGRYDRFVTDRDSLYVLAGAFVDPFAGYDLRSHEQIGYSRLLVDAEATSLRAELGFDVAQENYVEGIDPNRADIYAGRLLVGVSHKFNDAVGFTDTFELYENVVDLSDLRMLNTATLSSALSTKLSVKLSHALVFDNVPVEGFVSLDQTTMLTLVASIL